MKSNKSDFKYILIQGLITLLIAFIPIYFYIDASIKNQDIKKENINISISEKKNSFPLDSYQKQELKVILLEKIWKNHPIHSL